MMTEVRITASHIVYLLVCHRKLWLFANGVEMEHFSDHVLEGRHIHAASYPRRSSNYTEVQLDGVKIDFYDPATRTVHETKRGRAIEEAHRAQVQYYLYQLHRHGVEGARGLIEYPDLRRTEAVAPLTVADLARMEQWEAEVRQIVALDQCPAVIDKPYCRQCAYYDLCYIGET